MSKKIGILTFTYGDNYGQRLQNLAVQEILKKFGYEVYTLPQVVPSYYSPADKCRHDFFNQFDNEFIQYFSDTIGKNKIPKGLNDFSYFVTGSDQVWSPYSSDVNDSFFLTFAPKEKRIALSPSIAAKKIPFKKIYKYYKYFNGFNQISVREENAVNIIKKYTSVPVVSLIDPTLMFDSSFWDKYLKKPNCYIPDSYVLYYGLGSSDESSKIREFAKENNCEIIVLRAGEKLFASGPSEFLYLIKNSKHIFTDSYHGTIFSIIYKKSFTYIERTQNKVDMSSRFDTLFDKLNINKADIQHNYNDNFLNYDIIHQRILKEQNKFVNYLKNCINDKDVFEE